MIVPPATAAVPHVQVPVEMHPRGEGGHRPRPGGRRGKPCGANAGQDCHGGGRRFGGGQRTMASDFKVAGRQPCGKWVLRPFGDMHPRKKGLVPMIRFNAKVAVVSKMRIVSNTKIVSNTTFHFQHKHFQKDCQVPNTPPPFFCSLPGRGVEHAPTSFQEHQTMLPPLLPQVGQKQRVLCVLQSTRVVKNARIEFTGKNNSHYSYVLNVHSC
jgi:hypothetical protein